MKNKNSKIDDPEPLPHEKLKTLTEKELLDMLFKGRSNEYCRNRQAAYELQRRQEEKASKVQIRFMALATGAAIMSAIAAIINLIKN